MQSSKWLCTQSWLPVFCIKHLVAKYVCFFYFLCLRYGCVCMRLAILSKINTCSFCWMMWIKLLTRSRFPQFWKVSDIGFWKLYTLNFFVCYSSTNCLEICGVSVLSLKTREVRCFRVQTEWYRQWYLVLPIPVQIKGKNTFLDKPFVAFCSAQALFCLHYMLMCALIYLFLNYLSILQ